MVSLSRSSLFERVALVSVAYWAANPPILLIKVSVSGYYFDLRLVVSQVMSILLLEKLAVCGRF